jgi:hypothetical protein
MRTYVENVEDILKCLNSGDLSTELAKIRKDVKKVMDLSHGLKVIFEKVQSKTDTCFSAP